MDTNAFKIDDSLREYCAHNNNRQDADMPQTQPDLTKPKNIIQTAKAVPSRPTPLEYPCCLVHPTATAVCMFTLFVSLAITTGILVVCLTVPKLADRKCEYNLRPTVQYSSRDSSHPQSLTVGDFNNDGHMDIVVANTGFDSITMFFGCGNNSFTNQTSYFMGTGSAPRMVAVGDLNNDMRLDIVVANFGTNSIVILFGNGNGHFAHQKTIDTSPSHPLRVTVGDFDHDGLSDIAFVGHGTNKIGVILRLDDGNFTTPLDLFTGYDSLPYAIAVDDLNNDGRLDIVVANSGTDNIGLFFGRGNETFSTQITYPTGIYSRPSAIAIFDLDNDTRLDIAVTNANGNNIKIFYQYENEAFRSSTFSSSIKISNPVFIRIADFNNDNKPDITAVSNNTNRVVLFIGHGDGSFTDSVSYSTGPHSSPFSIDVADFNNDHQMDVAIVNQQNNNIKIFNSKTSQTFANEATSPISKNSSSNSMYIIPTGVNSNPVALAVGDVNNDDRLDLVVANCVAGNVAVLFGHTSGRFVSPVFYSTGTGSCPHHIILADFNNDNELDIAVADGRTHYLVILLATGGGEFSTPVRYPTGDGSMPMNVAAGDFNEDGQLDIAVANPKKSNIGVFFGYGNGEFSPPTAHFTGNNSGPNSIIVDDLNNDTHLDIVVTNHYANNIGIHLGLGNGEFSPQQTYSTGADSSPIDVVACDFNNDSRLDIAVAHYNTSSVGVFLGRDNGRFSAQTVHFMSAGSCPIGISVGDFNYDGCFDIGVVNNRADAVGVFLGYCNGSFSSVRIYSIGINTRPGAIVVGDFNNDNQVDIAVTDGWKSNVVILLGQNDGQFPSTTYPTKTSICSMLVAVGDLNNDGLLDIAVANYNNDNVDILLGYGNGSFESQAMLPTGNGSSPIAIAIADFNNDSRADIAVANFRTNSLGIFLSYSGRQFSSQMTYSTGIGSGPVSLAVSDLNHDGRPDILVANVFTCEVCVFIGDGSGNFSLETTYRTGDGTRPIWITVADFNNDARCDFAVANVDTYTIGIFLGHGNGTFQRQKTFSTGIYSIPVSIASCDFNNDGNMDIAVANRQSQEEHILILLGDGQGNLSNYGKYMTEAKSQLCSVAIGHFNNDSLFDIVVAMNGTRNVGVFLSYGDGTFSSWKNYSTINESHPISIAIGDFNDDNLTDLVVANYGTDVVSIRLATPETNFLDHGTLSTGSAALPRAITLGDFTNDGQLDIIVGNDGTHDIDLLLYDGDGSFSMQNVYSGDSTFYSTSIVAHDFNDDGRLDLAVVNAAMDTLTVLSDHGNRTFNISQVFSTGSHSSPQSMASGDFNNDNRTDLVVTYSGSESVGLFLKIDNGALENMRHLSTELDSKPHGLTVADFDGDGLLDIAVANNGKANIGFFFGFGNGSFSEQKMIPIGRDVFPQWVGAGDFNNDSRMDVVVSTNLKESPVIVLLGLGNRSFEVHKTNGLHETYGGAVDDFNNDGCLDVVLCQTSNDKIVILFGYGNGTFGNPIFYSTGNGSSPLSITTYDFNNDSWVDIAVANLNKLSIGVFLGNGNGTFPNQITYSTNPENPASITTGDLNNDGQVDIVIGTYGGHTFRIFYGFGNGSFQPISAYSRNADFVSLSIETGDLNNDGQLDIIVANSDDNNLSIILGHVNGTFFNEMTYYTGNYSRPSSIGVGDFNNDGRLDIVVSNMLSDSVGVFLGYVSENFIEAKAKNIGRSSQPVSIAAGDFNNDTHLDVAVADPGTDNIVILYGSQYGLFSTEQLNCSTGNGSNPNWVAVHDFNHDQHLDIAVVNSGSNNIAILLGNGNGTFSDLVTSSIEDFSLPVSFTVGHFNDDLHLDIVVANFDSNSVCLMFGYGNGSFAMSKCHRSGYDSRPFAVAAGDVNGDNLIDVVIANRGSSKIEILTKIC